MYSIKPIIDKQQWTNFLLQINANTFLQSWGWIKFNQLYGNKTWTLGMFYRNQLLSTAFVLKLEAKRGTFLFCPHGPQFVNFSTEMLLAWANYFKQLAKEERCSFVRISPIQENTQANQDNFRKCGFQQAPIHMHAERSVVLDLTEDLDKIRSKFKKSLRADIRKAERLIAEKKLTVSLGDEIDDEVYQVYENTFVRGSFVPFSKQYLQKELESFQEDNNCDLIKIFYQNQLVSWVLVVYFGSRAFYHQGANLLIKGVPAPTLAQWLAIQLAKQRGCQSYDFWGVCKPDEVNHPWYNLSRFKRSFGGKEVTLLPAQDLVINKVKYFPTWLIETIRRKWRGF